MEQILVCTTMNNFKCIGGACEETCCSGWTISINKKTYDLYMTAKDDKIVNFEENLLVLPPEKQNEFKYAELKKIDGKCAFLNENGLCKIHSRYGSQALSNICNTFPKQVNIYDGEYELGWTISCPEVVRYLLKGDNPKLEKLDASKFLSGVFTIAYIYEKDNYINNWQYKLDDIRGVILKIALDENLSSNDIMLKIGDFINDIQKNIKYIDKNKIELIKNRIDSNTKGISTDQQSEFFKLIVEIGIKRAISDKKYRKIFDKLLYNIGYDESKNGIENYERYLIAKKKVVDKFNDKIELFLKNYIINHVIAKMFPFCEDEGVFIEYSKFVLNYSLLYFHIISVLSEMDEFNEQRFVEVVVRFSRDIEHDKSFIYSIYNELNQSGLFNIDVTKKLIII